MPWLWAPSDWYAVIQRMDKNVSALLAQVGALQTQESKMAIDLTALAAAVAANTNVLNNLIAALKAIPPSNDPATQASLDALVATLTSDDATGTAAVAPPAPASASRR